MMDTRVLAVVCYLNIPSVVIAGVTIRSSYVAATKEKERDGTSVQSAGAAAAAAAIAAAAAC